MDSEPINYSLSGELNNQNTEDEEKTREMTRNFLAGKLTFSEYAAQMEDDDLEDDKAEGTNLNEEPSTSTAEQKPKTRVRRINRLLPPTLKGLMGEANLRYVRGDLETAEKICFEVIRQVPTAPDPFLTLAQMYETDNPEKSLQYSLMAAYLSPNDEGQWNRLAKLSENLGNFLQASTCYAKAITANVTNISSHLNRIQFMEKMGGDLKLIMRAKLRALSYMTAKHYDIMIQFAKELTEYYHKEGDIAKAMEALDFVFKKCPDHVDSELSNIMLELLLALKNYKYCLEIFVQHCGIDMELEHNYFTNADGEIEEKLQIISFQLPLNLPIDLHIKFIICLIHLKTFELIDPLLNPLLCEEEGVEKNGDLYLDVAEALMAENRHSDALKLLVPLVKSKNFGMAAVWLRHAECLDACKLHEQAIASYKKVMELAPLHLEMRFPLVDLLISMERKSEALAILEQDETCEEVDPGLLFKRCKLLKELKFFNKYWNAGLLLLSRHCFTIRNRDEVEKLTSMQRHERRGVSLKSLRAAKGEEIDDVTPVFSGRNDPSVEDEFELYQDLVETTVKRRRFDLTQRFTFTALSSKKFKKYKSDLEIMAIFACIFNEDCFHGYNLVRDLVQHYLQNHKAWNTYNIMIQRSDDVRHNRFLMRLLMRASVDPFINILHANSCLVAGTYKYALSEYINLYRLREDPLIAFLIGVTLFQIACQKFSVKKDYLVAQGVGFFNIYKKLRGPDGEQEVAYNLGRGYHQLGMLHLAIEQYKKVLKLKLPLAEKNPNLFDLKREAAYNLHLIYKASGSFDLAKMYLYKYIVV